MYEVAEESDFGTFYIFPFLFKTKKEAEVFCDKKSSTGMHYWYRKRNEKN